MQRLALNFEKKKTERRRQKGGLCELSEKKGASEKRGKAALRRKGVFGTKNNGGSGH
jgi:hypothetical protein